MSTSRTIIGHSSTALTIGTTGQGFYRLGSEFSAG